ncbi:MAG TPA: trehalose-phosphatase [Acidobacteriaceae bacterium]|nr:trehalose-phosphatase [Acidobacteriaceae bacterium]
MDSGVRVEIAGEGLRENPGSARVSPGYAAVGLSDWWRQLEGAPRSVLMLDYDGTLAPFVRERMQAKMYPGVMERLFRLAFAPRTRLVVVSGRPARDFATLLPPELHIEIWGSHGCEHITADGQYFATPLSTTEQRCLAELESELVRHGFGAVIEKKTGSLAMHTRGLGESDAARVRALGENFDCSLLAGGSGERGLELLPFDGGIELRGSGCSKASAVGSILRDEPRDAPAAFLGDDVTDEEAFAALANRGAEARSLRVLVRPEPRPSTADLWLSPPGELLAFLDRWVAAVGGTHEAGEVRR